MQNIPERPMHERLSFQNGCIGTCSAPVFGKALLCVGRSRGLTWWNRSPLVSLLCFLSLSWAFISSYTLWCCYLVPYKRSAPTYPQLCPVVDWYLQNWARLNLFFIFIVYPTPLYFGNKILVGSLGWPWTPPYPSVSASKRAGITDIHHRVLPLQMLLIPGFCFSAGKLSWWTCLVLCSSS